MSHAECDSRAIAPPNATLDRALTDAANRYSLAAQIVHRLKTTTPEYA